MKNLKKNLFYRKNHFQRKKSFLEIQYKNQVILDLYLPLKHSFNIDNKTRKSFSLIKIGEEEFSREKVRSPLNKKISLCFIMKHAKKKKKI